MSDIFYDIAYHGDNDFIIRTFDFIACSYAAHVTWSKHKVCIWDSARWWKWGNRSISLLANVMEAQCKTANKGGKWPTVLFKWWPEKTYLQQSLLHSFSLLWCPIHWIWTFSVGEKSLTAVCFRVSYNQCECRNESPECNALLENYLSKARKSTYGT